MVKLRTIKFSEYRLFLYFPQIIISFLNDFYGFNNNL